MNTPRTHDTDLPAELRMQLRGLRADIAPPAHLWDAIDARLDRVAVQPPARRVQRRAFALAAALAVAAIGGSWAWSTLQAPTSPLARHADAELQDAYATLDRDARRIRRALREDPDSRVLLQQLHRVDAIRHTLERRAAFG